jgi:hypothetical protein
MTERKALGLLTLLVTNSQLNSDLNAQLNQPGQTPNGFWTALMNSVAPLGITAADLTDPAGVNRTTLEPLWLQGGVLQPQVTQDAQSIGVALSPPLTYMPGPCPKGVLQSDFMQRLP